MFRSMLKRKLLGAGLATAMCVTAGAQNQEELAKSPKYVKHNEYNLSLDKRFETTLFAAPPYVEYVTAVFCGHRWNCLCFG